MFLADLSIGGHAVDLLTLALKGLAGGTLVLVFALIGEVIRPRSIAGILSGAPSVASAGLAVTVLSTGVTSAWNQSLAMIVGAAGLVVWCLVAVDAVKRFGGLKGSLAATVVWFAVAFSLWGVILR
jgi:hypothetical protein